MTEFQNAANATPSQPVTFGESSLTPGDKVRQLRALCQLTARSEHGVAYVESADGATHIAIARIDGLDVQTVPTRISRQEYETILGEVLPIKETQDLLYKLALRFNTTKVVGFEGGTGISKTFSVNVFNKLRKGPHAKILDFYCNAQTDASDLMGRYVPAGLNPEQLGKINQFLHSDAGAALKADLLKENGKVEHDELVKRVALLCGFPIQQGSFRFQTGVLPRAMTATIDENGTVQDTPDGPGCILHVQEVGLASPGVINSLLKLRGEKRKVALDIQLQEGDGHTVTAGEEFFLVFSTNPTGKNFKDRNDLCQSLTRHIPFYNLMDELSPESLEKATAGIFDFTKVSRREGSPGAILDLREHSALSEVLGEVVLRFHQMYLGHLKDGEPGRTQRFPATLDWLWDAAELLQNCQIVHKTRDEVDFIETLKGVINGVYIAPLQSKPDPFGISGIEEHANAEKSLGHALLKQLDQILNDDTLAPVKVDGAQMSPVSAIEMLTRKAFDARDLTDVALQEQARRAAIEVEISAIMQDLELLLPPERLDEIKRVVWLQMRRYI